MDNQPFRTMSGAEKSILHQLLSPAFPGRDHLVCQLDNCLVRNIDAPGWLEFNVHTLSVEKNMVKHGIPVEGEAIDIDGTPIYFLLHVKDSQLSCLEWYKADSSKIVKMPPAKDIDVYARQ